MQISLLDDIFARSEIVSIEKYQIFLFIMEIGVNEHSILQVRLVTALTSS